MGRKPNRSKSSSKVVRQFFDEMDRQGVTGGQLTKVAGIYSEAAVKWRSGECLPRIDLFEAAAQAIGMEVRLCRAGKNHT